MIPKDGVGANQINEELARGEKRGCLPEMLFTMMMSVALDGKFDACCPILDSDESGWGPEINHVPRRLVLSLFAFFTDIPNHNLTASSLQLQRELQGLCRSRAFSVH